MKQLTDSLYSVKRLSEESWEVKLADKHHPVFEAHFEGNPLLPAFLQIDIMSEILDRNLMKIQKAKFKLPILPDDLVVYEIIKKEDHTYTIKIFKENRVTSEMKLVYA